MISNRVFFLQHKEGEHEIKGVGQEIAKRRLSVIEAFGLKSLTSCLTVWLSSSLLLFRTFCPFFQLLLLPGLSGVQLASEGQLCAAV